MKRIDSKRGESFAHGATLKAPGLVLAVRAATAGNGATAAAIAAEIGLSLSYCRTALKAAKVAGLVDVLWVAERQAHWMRPELAEAMRPTLAAGRLERERERCRRANRRRRGTVELHARNLSDHPKQRLSASGPLPFTVNAPASVFHLGAACVPLVRRGML